MMNKRVAVEVDRLSDLPINVINLIQEYVHLDAAARMSILSSKWRYIWASHPKLLIYEHFSRNRNDQSGIIITSHHPVSSSAYQSLRSCLLGSGTFNLYSILKCQKLDELIYCPQEEVSQNDEMINMPQLPIICPKIRHFVFDRYSLKIDCTKSNGLKASFSEIERCKKIKELNNLEILNLKQFQGSLEEIWFVMSVLASTPLLKKIVISFHRGVDEANASRIYQWLICLTILPGSPLNKLSRPEPTPWAGPALEDHFWPQVNPWPGFLNSAETYSTE
ncbi:hypothetical protein KY289_000598 [Solanum tuberosum]|nr:hypothetical protein KY289_000598 [Solanum tuberosum]